MLKPQTQVIDGYTYTVTPYPASVSVDLLPRLSRLLGEKGMQLLFAPTAEELAVIMAEPEVIAALVSSAMQRAGELPGGLSSFCKELLATTEVDRVRIGDAEGKGSIVTHFDTHFAARLKHLFDVVTFAARVGFGGP